MDRRNLNDGGDDCDAKIDPIASASMEVTPIGTEPEDYLDQKNERNDSFRSVCGTMSSLLFGSISGGALPMILARLLPILALRKAWASKP